MRVTLYTANCKGNQKNCIYPNRCVIEDEIDFMAAVGYDHVCAWFDKNYRSKDNFRTSDVDVMDCDNDHSENPDDWIYPENYEKLFPDVSYIVVPSRNNMKVKDGKTARPRHHVYFPHDLIETDSECVALKTAIYQKFPFFDENALDAARFIYGTNCDEIIWHEGEITIDCLLKPSLSAIPQGQRNTTMSRFAGRVVKRYGATDHAHEIFLEEAAKCDPPLDEEELGIIWSSATKFARKIQNQDGYVSPDEYNDDFACETLKPADYSDIGQAKVVSREYGDELCFTDATDYLRYNGEYWVESKQRAVGAMEEFLDLQLQDALDEMKTAMDVMIKSGADENEVAAGGKRFEKTLEGDQLDLYRKYLIAKQYLGFVMKRRDMKYVVSALQAAKPMLAIEVSDLDKDEYLLNVPGQTYHLMHGLEKAKVPESSDFITKQTTCAPGDGGNQLWLDALDTFFCKDQKLIDYVQQIVGMASVGKVYVEALIIAYGEGRNGKSTFWNTIARVLGSYAGNMSADTLTVGCKRNVKPEMAELKGKRLVIAAELEEGMRLNTSIIKQLCSTDDIYAEKKYKDPFKFTPSHTIVLYTNHLPRVGANDEGTWRRLIVIPFDAKIEGRSDIKNYADYLYQNAGSFIMQWIIEGAQKVIKQNFKLSVPACVSNAIGEYRKRNDWFGNFLDDCCEVDSSYQEKSGELYDEYRAYCLRMGEYTRNSADFYAALENGGFRKQKKKNIRLILGLKLKSPFEEE
ncbi:phage/plasmid primase, P4 family [uncultured Clostridium sp.]|uniref:phage/plasmid primase, P4 family n=1 Tax=uncultured Clostridium sp. TaxID=59620 RepID=UPI0025E1CA3C|nr:phage/plasmid primase, P4 family [uncultured Clostridium sp.]